MYPCRPKPIALNVISPSVPSGAVFGRISAAQLIWCAAGSCQVAEHCWDPVGPAIITYGYLFDGLIQARQREL